jgi:Nuclease A inhibitor-like protein
VPEDAAQLSPGGEISVATTSRKSSVKKNAANSNPPLATKLSKALGALANDLPNPADESTDYFHPFVAPLASSSELSPETIKQALKVGASYRIDLSSADDFFSGATDESNWGEFALGFRLLEKVMRASLSELSVAFARRENVVRVRMWLFGRTEDGTLVGLRAMTTET